MLGLKHRSAALARPMRTALAANYATHAPRIGDTKVAMSLLEKDKYINYQRIEDNLAIVRKRFVFACSCGPGC
jgi:aconitate hydratase